MRRGASARYEVGFLLERLALIFMELGLQPTTTQDGAFVFVARVFHPECPTTIKHSVLTKAIANARADRVRDPSRLGFLGKTLGELACRPATHDTRVWDTDTHG